MPLSEQNIAFLETYVLKSRVPENVRMAVPPGPGDKGARVDQAGEFLRMAREISVPEGATSGEAERIRGLRGQLSRLLDDNVTAAELKAAAQIVLDLQAAHKEIVEQVAQRKAADEARRQEARATLIKALQAALARMDGEFTSTDREEITAAVDATEKALPATPSDEELSVGQAALEEIGKRIETANQAAETARQQRAEQGRKLAEDARGITVEHGAPEELKTLRDMAEALVGDLPDIPSDTELETGRKALAALKARADEIALAVAERLKRVEKAKALLAKLVWGKGDLELVKGAPAATAEGLKQRCDELATDKAAMGDPARAHEWQEDALSALDEAVTKLIGDVAAANTAVKEALAEVEQAAQKTRAAITSTKGLALNDAQQDVLEKLVVAEIEKAEADSDAAKPAIKALEEVRERAVKLGRVLSLLDARIKRVEAKPADALPSELKTLETARKAAVDSLGKIEP